MTESLADRGGRAIARAALLFLGLSGGHAFGQDYSDTQRARLRDGDVLIENIKNAEGIHGLKAAFLVKARPEAVWNLLVDYKRLHEIFANVEELRVLEENPKGARVRYRVRAAWISFQYTLERNYEQPGKRLTYRRIDGDLKGLSGEWAIREGPDDEHQLVVCESFVDVGGLVPGALVRSQAAHDLRDTARRMRQRLEKPLVAQ